MLVLSRDTTFLRFLPLVIQIVDVLRIQNNGCVLAAAITKSLFLHVNIIPHGLAPKQIRLIAVIQQTRVQIQIGIAVLLLLFLL